MKYRSSLICLCIFLAGLMIINQSFGDEAKIKDTAVGIWLFEDNADDSSGKKNHGQLKNGAKISGGGKFGNALSLDGKDDYVLVNPSASLESSSKQYTGVAWVKLDKEGVQRNACCNDDQFVVGWTPGWHNLLLVFGAGRNTNQGKWKSEVPNWLRNGTPAPNRSMMTNGTIWPLLTVVIRRFSILMAKWTLTRMPQVPLASRA